MEKIDILRAQVRASVKPAAIYEQLAEECTELAKAALKCARYLRGENPMGKDDLSWYSELREEYNDVLNCIKTLDMGEIESEYDQYVKTQRWVERLDREGLLKEVV